MIDSEKMEEQYKAARRRDEVARHRANKCTLESCGVLREAEEERKKDIVDYDFLEELRNL